MRRNDEWTSRVKSVESEYRTMRQAVGYFREAVFHEPGILERGSEFRHIDVAADRLELTYFIRLFAEFESALRAYWATQKPTKPKLTDLLDGAASRRRIPSTELEFAHAVRKYRNNLVHDSEGSPEPIALAVARGYLSPQW
jgi:hypothetical protein